MLNLFRQLLFQSHRWARIGNLICETREWNILAFGLGVCQITVWPRRGRETTEKWVSHPTGREIVIQDASLALVSQRGREFVGLFICDVVGHRWLYDALLMTDRRRQFHLC